jgi:hypothetical protein
VPLIREQDLALVQAVRLLRGAPGTLVDDISNTRIVHSHKHLHIWQLPGRRKCGWRQRPLSHRRLVGSLRAAREAVALVVICHQRLHALANVQVL